MREAVIVSATRTAVGKAPNGALKTVRPDEMAAAVIGEVLRRVPSLQPAEIDNVILGCAMREADSGRCADEMSRRSAITPGVVAESSDEYGQS